MNSKDHINDYYLKTIVPELQKILPGVNIMALPKLLKIVINCGMGEAISDKKSVESMQKQLSFITGQRPAFVKARRAISSFKLREGDIIGLKATLRGKRMYDFLTRLVKTALPRVRDFHGVPLRSFDGKGNYTLGISEQTIFPDLDYNIVDKNRGFEITFVTSSNADSSCKILLETMGIPFEKNNNLQEK